MPIELHIQFWENRISDLLIKNRWLGKMIQSFPRQYLGSDLPRIITEDSIPVLVLPRIGIKEEQALLNLQDLAYSINELDENASSWSAEDLKSIPSFLINYFGSIDLFDLEIPVLWNDLITKHQSVENVLDWKSLLYEFTAQFGNSTLAYSNRKLSKRYGTAPGRLWKRKSRLALILDVSASMDKVLLGYFLAEMDNLVHKGFELTLFQVDDRIRSIEPYRYGMSVASARGGGTNFNSAIQYIEKGDSYDGLLLCTDGLLQFKPQVINMNHLWILEDQKALPFDLGVSKVHLKA